MDSQEYAASRKHAATPYGDIAYVERGAGPAALFVHGVLLNGYLWRDVIEALAPHRRCIAIDLMAHGHTRTATDQPMSFDDQAEMIAAFVAAMGLGQVDLVANDSGGGIAQVFAARHPEMVRSLVLTNCDTHDNWPPEALKGFMGIVANGQLGATGKALLASIDAARGALGIGYERPQDLSEETVRTYLEPLMASDESVAALERMIMAFDNTLTVRVEPLLKQLPAPALIVWGTDDPFFDKKWAYWLRDTLPGAVGVIEAPGAKLFFPEERPQWLAGQIAPFWAKHSVVAAEAAAR